MYKSYPRSSSRLWAVAVLTAALAAAAAPAWSQTAADAPAARPPAPGSAAASASGSSAAAAGGYATSIIHKIHAPSEQIELSVNSSRILTLDQRVPWAQVNNPDLLELHPLSPSEIQVFGKAPGVTQINLRTEDQKIYTIEATVLADSQALSATLKMLFPNAAIHVIPVTTGVILAGYVDQADHVKQIVEIAQEYYPHVINTMQVAGAQQVLLHVKVMEVSRTKLRQLGFDFAKSFNGNMMYSGAAGLLSYTGNPATLAANGQNLYASVLDSTGSFIGVLQALRQDNLAKILAEPTLTTVSGRPAYFLSGGQIPILVPESLGTVSIDYKNYGTQIDFVPVVLGNGRIHLDVRPRVSELDSTHSVTIGSTTVPGLLTREVETGVEMKAGQTLAIAGLVQTYIDAQNSGLPVLSELPVIGAAFRNVKEEYNEIELLILVTPELAEAVNACDMPPGGPGLNTTTPNDCELYLKGHLEVPLCNPPARGAAPSPQYSSPVSADAMSGGVVLPAGSATGGTASPEPIDAPAAPLPADAVNRRPSGPAAPVVPVSAETTPPRPPLTVPPPNGLVPGPGSRPSTFFQPTPATDGPPPNQWRPVTPSATNSANVPTAAGGAGEPAFLGPVGYDVR